MRTVGPVTLPAVMGGGPNRSKVAAGTSTRANRTLSVSPDHQPAWRRARIAMRGILLHQRSASEKLATVLAPLNLGKGMLCIFPNMHEENGVLFVPFTFTADTSPEPRITNSRLTLWRLASRRFSSR